MVAVPSFPFSSSPLIRTKGIEGCIRNFLRKALRGSDGIRKNVVEAALWAFLLKALGEAERIKLQMSERSEFLQFSGASLRAFKKDHADAEMTFYESIHL